MSQSYSEEEINDICDLVSDIAVGIVNLLSTRLSIGNVKADKIRAEWDGIARKAIAITEKYDA